MKKDHELSGGDTLRKQTLPWQKATGIMIHHILYFYLDCPILLYFVKKLI